MILTYLISKTVFMVYNSVAWCMTKDTLSIYKSSSAMNLTNIKINSISVFIADNIFCWCLAHLTLIDIASLPLHGTLIIFKKKPLIL